MLTALCVATVFICWGVGLAIVYRGLNHEGPGKIEPLAPKYDSTTLNQDLEGLY